MYEISERRKHKRLKKQLIISRFRAETDEVQDMTPTDWDIVTVGDLGAGGVFFHVRRNMEIGTTVDLKISFSISMPPIECRGVVTRVEKHPNHSEFGIATKFTEIDEHIKEMINKIALSEDPDDQFLYNKEYD